MQMSRARADASTHWRLIATMELFPRPPSLDYDDAAKKFLISPVVSKIDPPPSLELV